VITEALPQLSQRSTIDRGQCIEMVPERTKTQQAEAGLPCSALLVAHDLHRKERRDGAVADCRDEVALHAARRAQALALSEPARIRTSTLQRNQIERRFGPPRPLRPSICEGSPQGGDRVYR